MALGSAALKQHEFIWPVQHGGDWAWLCSHCLSTHVLSWRALWVWSCSASFARLRCANPKQLGWNLWVCSCIRQVWEGPTWSSVGQIRVILVGAHWSWCFIGVQVYVLYYSNKIWYLIIKGGGCLGKDGWVQSVHSSVCSFCSWFS